MNKKSLFLLTVSSFLLVQAACFADDKKDDDDKGPSRQQEKRVDNRQDKRIDRKEGGQTKELPSQIQKRSFERKNVQPSIQNKAQDREVKMPSGRAQEDQRSRDALKERIQNRKGQDDQRSRDALKEKVQIRKGQDQRSRDVLKEKVQIRKGQDDQRSRDDLKDRVQKFRSENQDRFKRDREFDKKDFQIKKPDQSPLRQVPKADSKSKERFFERDRKDDGQKRAIKEPRLNRIDRDKFKVREEKWRDRGRSVRNRFVDDRKRHHIFDDYFWNRFRRNHRNLYFDSRFSWSNGASWSNVVVWLPWRWNTPVYYYYADNGAVYYGDSPNSSYLVPVSSPRAFIAEAIEIANKPFPLSIDSSSLMPLGMYALTYDNGSDERVEYISLAISKQGFITGAYFNAATGETLEIQGSVDSDSQRVAWKFVGREWPIMESGLYNLTQEEATLLVHSSSSRTDSRVVVRLE